MKHSPKQTKLFVLLPNLDMGGAERVVVTMLSYFDRLSFDIHLVIFGTADGALASEIPSDIKVTAFGKPRLIRALPPLIQLIWQERPKVVFSNLSYINLMLSTIKQFLPLNTRIVVRESSIVSINTRAYYLWRVWWILYVLFYRRLDFIVCESAAMRDDLLTNFFIPISKSSIIFNPLDVSKIRRLSRAKPIGRKLQKLKNKVRFVSVGNLRAEKRFDRLLQALALIPNDRISIDIIGEGREKSTLQLLCEELGIGDRVNFRGFQKNPYGWIAGSDALILSSDYEGAPNVVLEALCLGVPVIATPAGGGVQEMLAGRNDCVIANGYTPCALAKAIETWMAIEKRGVFQDNLENYEASHIVRKHEAIFLGS